MSSFPGRGGIFISYRREEAAAHAGRLHDRLSTHFGEDRVFIDINSIAIGADFTSAVIEAVSECNVLLALIGRDWSTVTDDRGKRRIDDPGDWVRVEIETALKRDIQIIPVLVNGAVLPQADDLPPSLRSLTSRQAIELSDTSFRSEVTRLIAALGKVVEAEPSRSVDFDPKKVELRRHGNPRFDFWFSYPAGWARWDPHNGDGNRFVSPEDPRICVVFFGTNTRDMERRMDPHSYQGEIIHNLYAGGYIYHETDAGTARSEIPGCRIVEKQQNHDGSDTMRLYQWFDDTYDRMVGFYGEAPIGDYSRYLPLFLDLIEKIEIRSRKNRW